MKIKDPVFVTFEGTEGAGKSTLIRKVAERLEQNGFSVVVTREPGGSPFAEKIRDLILNSQMTAWTELFLYEAARAEHLQTTILPALAQGKIVLCDRFTDSSLAYQGHARGLPWKRVHEANQLATQGVTPKLSIFVDIDPALGLSRAQDKNRFEAEGVAFQSKVRQGFLKAIRLNPKRWLKIQGHSAPPEVLAELVIREIQRRFKKVRIR